MREYLQEVLVDLGHEVVAAAETGLQLVHRTGGLIMSGRGSAGMEFCFSDAASPREAISK